MAWFSFDGKQLSKSVYEEVKSAIEREKALGHSLKVCIGSDSQVKHPIVQFATVIVFLREHAGGFMFIQRVKTENKMSIKQRMLHEVALSIDVAYQLSDLLDRHHIELEVHADINTDPRFKSNTALSDAMGYILSMGFIFKAKPDAFASTSCANKYVQ